MRAKFGVAFVGIHPPILAISAIKLAVPCQGLLGNSDGSQWRLLVFKALLSDMAS
jgi:hypothetical protein